MAAVNVTFSIQVDIALTAVGDRHVCVLGNIAELGEWQVDKIVPLQRSANSNEWRATLSLPRGHLIEYKYAISSKSNHQLICWESLPGNRTFVAGCTNSALHKSAEQSSTYVALSPPVLGPRLPSLALNGNTNGRHESYCARTKQELQAWWQVDLGQVLPVTNIGVWARQYLTPDEIFPLWILLSDKPFHRCTLEDAKSRAKLQQRFTTVQEVTHWALTSPATVQYVRIQLDGDAARSLQLAEVQIHTMSQDSSKHFQCDGWFGLDTRELGNTMLYVDSHWLAPNQDETRLLFGSNIKQAPIYFADGANKEVHLVVRVPNLKDPIKPVTCHMDPLDPSSSIDHVHRKLLGNSLDQHTLTSLQTTLDASSLRELPLFTSLSKSVVEEILAGFETIKFTDGQDIVLTGRPRRYLYIIQDGEVHVRGEETSLGDHTYLELGHGSFFGELALISGATRAVRVVAKGATVCHRLHREDFQSLLGRHGITVDSLLQNHVSHLISTDPFLNGISTHAVADSSPIDPHVGLQLFSIPLNPSLIYVDVMDHQSKQRLGTATISQSQLTGSNGFTSSLFILNEVVIGEIFFRYLRIRPFNNPNNSIAHSRVFPLEGSTLDVGHRGLGRSYYQRLGHRLAWIRENTLPSFIVAGYYGADFIEFDVQLSKDRIPIVYHDYFFSAKLGHRVEKATLFTKTGLHDLTLDQLNRIEWRHCVQKPSRLRSLIQKHWRKILKKDSAPPYCIHHFDNERVPSPFQALCDAFPTLKSTFENVPLYVGFNIEIKYPMEKHDDFLCDLPAFEMNAYVDAILECVWRYAGSRRIYFSCFAPDICAILRAKQTKYPVLYLTSGTNIEQEVRDKRCIALEHAVAFSRMENLHGVVTNSNPLIQTPSLISAIKNQNLLVYTWGDQNTSHEKVQLQKKYGIDAVISDNVGDLTHLDEKIRPPKMEGSKVYIPDEKHVWIPATIIRMEDDGKKVLLRISDSPDGKTIPDRWIDLRDDGMPNELPLQNDTRYSVQDMCTLNHLHEPAIVYNLQSRFNEKQPYTYTGSIVVAINPYAWLNLYSKDIQKQYLGDRTSLPPHVYATSASAFQSMVQYERHQSILVSGESGAGKTETVKILMEHLATISTTNPNLTIVAKVLKSSPLLEAFGNAKTIRNDNSSRFGKFTQLQFDVDSQLIGAKCRHYLLEKSRVITQSDNERNYHIFYQLRASKDSRWQLNEGSYAYLREDKESEQFLLDGQDDLTRYQGTRDALTTIGVSLEDQNALLDALAGILHLGQIHFKSKQDGEVDGSIPIQTTTAWNATCQLLGFKQDPSMLATSLCNRTVKARLEVYVVPLTTDQAQTNRDALAKELYARLFGYLVHRVNESISNDRLMHRHIDLLDIFGFEAFDINRFEQFCINFANEKLQQKFTHDVFKSVQEEYQQEGLGWSYVSFQDNQDMLDLLEAPLGVIPLLNEECIRPMGNDITFCSKVISTYEMHPRLDKQKARLSTSHFALKHYAGTVMYNVDGFVERNKDALSTEVVGLLSTSSNKLIQHVFRQMENNPKKKNGTSTSFMGETVVSKFKTQLTGLMTDIEATQVHYIRCIKPNNMKNAFAFDIPGVIDQLRCAGVIEAIRISRSAFPNKMSHEKFLQRFVLFQLPRSGLTVASACSQLVTQLVGSMESKSTFVLGTRNIYFASGILEELEKKRTTYLQIKAITVQRIIRGYICRRRFRLLKKMVVFIQARYKKIVSMKLYQMKRNRIILIQSLWRGKQCRRIVAAKRFEKSVIIIQRNFRKYCARKQYNKFRQAVITLQAQMKQKTAAAKFRAQKKELQAQQSMEMELVSLKTRLDEEKHARQAMEVANTQLQTELQKAAVLEPSYPPRPSSAMSNLDDVSLLDDSGRMLETLQREVQKWREIHEKDQNEIEVLKSEVKRIKEAYTAAGASFAALNQHNKQQSKANLRLMSTHAALIKSQEEKMKKYQKQVADLKEELKHQKNVHTIDTTSKETIQEKTMKILRDEHVAPEIIARIRQAIAASDGSTLLRPQSSSELARSSHNRPSDSSENLRDESSTSATERSSWAVPKENRGSSIYYEEDPNRKSGIGGMFKKMFKKNET